MTVSPAQLWALKAVRAGEVHHAHPFTWVVGLPYLDVCKPRSLQSLARHGLIKVDASSRDYARPVHLTIKGRVALGSEPDA